MRHIQSVYKLSLVALTALVLQSCEKREPPVFENDKIITKPYSLYVVDSFGRVWNTNDGDIYRSIFGAPGPSGRAITTAGDNVIWAQQTNGLWGTDIANSNQVQFNLIKMAISPAAFNQSMALSVPDWNRVYLAGNDGKGIIYSDSAGKAGTWKVDNAFNTSISGAVTVTSFTRTDNGIAYAYDYINKRLFKKANQNALWDEVIMSGMPADGKFFLSNLQNTLVLGDSTGAQGVWYSNSGGTSWAQYTGITTGAKILCMSPAFGQTLIVGTEANGVWRLPLNSTKFDSSSIGLEQNTMIRGIAAKSNLYKNDRVVQYIYLATDKGVFRSKDIGASWFNAFPAPNGNTVLIY